MQTQRNPIDESPWREQRSHTVVARRSCCQRQRGELTSILRLARFDVGFVKNDGRQTPARLNLQPAADALDHRWPDRAQGHYRHMGSRPLTAGQTRSIIEDNLVGARGFEPPTLVSQSKSTATQTFSVSLKPHFNALQNRYKWPLIVSRRSNALRLRWTLFGPSGRGSLHVDPAADRCNIA
jgi:hypothetical protein